MKDSILGEVSKHPSMLGEGGKIEYLCAYRADFKVILFDLERLMEAKESMDKYEVTQANVIIKKQLNLLKKLMDVLSRQVRTRS